MTFFLTAKHWQIFLLTFGLSIVGVSTVMVNDLFSLLQGILLSTDLVMKIVYFVQCVAAVSLLLWLYVVGTRLYEKHYYNKVMLKVFQYTIYVSTVFSVTRYLGQSYWIATFSHINRALTLIRALYCSYFLAHMLRLVKVGQ